MLARGALAVGAAIQRPVMKHRELVICGAMNVEFDDIGTAAEVITNAAATLLHTVVIASVQDPWQDDVVNLKRSHPGLVVLGLGGDGRVTWLYELVPWPHVLGALGPAELRSTVLAAVHATTTT